MSVFILIVEAAVQSSSCSWICCRSTAVFLAILLTGCFYRHPDDMCRVSTEQQTCNKSHV